MTQEKHNNKENKSNLVTIEVKAITTVADANEVILRNRAAMTEYVRTELQKLGEPWPVCHLTTGLFTIKKDENPYDYIIDTANVQMWMPGTYFLKTSNLKGNLQLSKKIG